MTVANHKSLFREITTEKEMIIHPLWQAEFGQMKDIDRESKIQGTKYANKNENSGEIIS